MRQLGTVSSRGLGGKLEVNLSNKRSRETDFGEIKDRKGLIKMISLYAGCSIDRATRVIKEYKKYEHLFEMFEDSTRKKQNYNLEIYRKK
jgi:hypothetical protein